MRLTISAIRRFETRHTKDGPEHPTWGKCWQWLGNLKPHGYGKLTIGDRDQPAHRVAWEIFIGTIPEGLGVLHHCDNRGCVNPSHLFLGTNGDNILDMESKGRAVHPFGEDHGRAKLTAADVLRIRKEYRIVNHKSNAAVLAFELGVSKELIHQIVQGRCWKHLL